MAAEDFAEGGPEEGTDGEAENEERKTDCRDFITDIEVGGDFADTAAVYRGGEGDSQRAGGYYESDGDFAAQAEEHRVAVVVRDPRHHIRVVFGPVAGEVVFQDFLCDGCLVGEEAPEGDFGPVYPWWEGSFCEGVLHLVDGLM